MGMWLARSVAASSVVFVIADMYDVLYVWWPLQENVSIDMPACDTYATCALAWCVRIFNILLISWFQLPFLFLIYIYSSYSLVLYADEHTATYAKSERAENAFPVRVTSMRAANHIHKRQRREA